VESDHVKLKKAVALLQKKGMDGLIIFSGGTCSILRPSYLYYFAGFKPMGYRNAAVVSKTGDVALLVEPRWDEGRVSDKSWIGDVRGTSDFVQDLIEILTQWGIRDSVGVAGAKEMTRDVYLGIEEKFKIQPADEIIEEMAREKTAHEIDVVREVARIADIGFHAFLNHARVGMREYELAAHMEYAMRCSGADDIFILLSSDKHNYEMHEPTDRRFEEGDVIIGEITPVIEGQFFQLCRTVALGQPGALIKGKYGILLEALEKTLCEVRAGVPASVISRTMNGVISDAGYAKYCYPPYMRARGHGFGAGSLAPGGVIDDNTRAPLVKDQVVVIHPNQWIPETGYLACGETYLITASGYEKCAETETKLYVKEG